MDDIGTLIQSVLAMANDGKWWALGAVVIGAAIRFTKPDVRWFPNLDARWRPIAAALLGVVLSVLNMIASSNDWKSALQWGMSAAVAAMMGHLFGIEVARNGKELPMPGTNSGGGSAGGGPGGKSSEQTSAYSARMVAFALAVSVAALPGCAAFTKAQPDITNTITTIQADIQEANLWISIISDAAQLLFGDSQSDAAVKFKQAEDAAKLALAGLTRAANGAGDVNQGTYDAAFSEFRSAYKAFVAAAQALGIVAPDGVLSVPHNGKLEAYRAPITKEVVRVPELHLLAGKK